MGFKEEKKDVEQMMVAEFTSPLIAELRANGGTVKRGDVTIKLAEFYGFCWGVERAVSIISFTVCSIFKTLHKYENL
jgi:4-hydroxy-3-methylbut-2-enyl diphosphate reductase